MNDSQESDEHSLPFSENVDIDEVCDRFESAHRSRHNPKMEDFVGSLSGQPRTALLAQLILLDLDYRHLGNEPPAEDYLERFPEDRDTVLRAVQAFERERDTRTRDVKHSAAFPARAIRIRCPHCFNPVALAVDSSFAEITCDSCGSRFSLIGESSTTRDAPELATVGHFELIERIGIGGFGTVWKARDTKLDRSVAVKIPRQGQLTPLELEKFFREARAAAQLNHPNIVGVHEVGRDGETVYIVSDLVRGISLFDWMSGVRATVAQAAELCRTIADALQHAHTAGVIHRDLKPQNILIDADFEPFITDFGLARRESGEITVTVDGQLLGTPAYMSPEQAAGEGHFADRRSDVYSVGAILFQLLTSELPFRGNAEMLIHQVIYHEPPSPRLLNRLIPRDMETICLKCLQKNPALRYQRAADLSADLGRFLRNDPIVARPISRVTRGIRWCRRNPAIATLSAVVAGVLLIGIIVSTFFAIRAHHSQVKTTAALVQTLFSRSKLLRQTRPEGYRSEVFQSVEDVLRLGGESVDTKLLRQEAVGAMGDFVGLTPKDYDGFPAQVNAVAFSPADGNLALGLAHGQVRIIDPDSGDVQSEWRGPFVSIEELSFGEAGKHMLVAGRSDTPALMITRLNLTAAGQWESTSTHELSGNATNVSFSRDRRLALAQDSESVTAWNVDTGRSVWDFTTDELSLNAATLSPDGRYLAVGYRDSDWRLGLLIWNVERRTIEHQLELNLGYCVPHSIAFNDAGTLLAYGSDESIIMFEVPSMSRRFVQRSDSIQALAFGCHSQFLATLDLRGNLTLHGVAVGKRIAELSHPRRRSGVRSVIFSHDGHKLVAAQPDAIRIWNLAGAAERRLLAGHAKSVPATAFSTSGNLLASGSKDRTVAFWEPNTGEKLAELPAFPGEIQSIALRADGKKLATAYWGPENETIQIWDVSSHQLDASIQNELGDVNRLTFVGDTGNLAAGGDRGLEVWEWNNGEYVSVLRISEFRCLDVTSSPNGALIAWPNENKIHIRDFAQSRTIEVGAPLMMQGWHGLAFSSDSQHLLYVDHQGFVEQWNVHAQSSHLRMGTDRQFRAPHVALSPNGKLLAALVEADTVAIWNAETGKEWCVLRPERAAIRSLGWSSDNASLAMGLADGGLVVWSVEAIQDGLRQLGIGE